MALLEHHLDTSNVTLVDRVSSCDKRTSHVPCLQPPPLTVWVGRVTINILPDDVLLFIFYFDQAIYLDGLGDFDRVWLPSWRWHRLVHVCQRWRSVVFGSPNFLDLRLVCGPRTPLELTSIWPLFPISIENLFDTHMPGDYDFEAAMVHHNRVCEIRLNFLTRSQLKRLASAMRVQFPALIHLRLEASYYDYPYLALPDGFLDGCAPRLQSLTLNFVAFPALPKFLLSATDLVHLTLWSHTQYISPEAIVTGLAALSNLESLIIEYKSPTSSSNLDPRYPPPLTRTVLPAVTRFEFGGKSKDFEDLVAWIDTPLLDSIWIVLFQRQSPLHIPQFAEFMRRTTRFQTLNEAYVNIDEEGVQVESLPPTRAFHDRTGMRISSLELDWQLLYLAEVFTSFFPSIFMLERVYIYGPQYLPSSSWQYLVVNLDWLEMLQPLTAVKNLYGCKEFAKSIAPVLQELVGERAIDVLPALECLFLEDFRSSGPVQEAIKQFVAARRFLGRPVAVSHWDGSLFVDPNE